MSLCLNKKYTNFYTYEKKTGFIFNEKGELIDRNDIIYKIIDYYKDMLSYLTDIQIIPHRSMKDAANGLVYKGFDSKKRAQYRYGDNYKENRTIEKKKTFLYVHENLSFIEKIIEEELKEKDVNDIFLFGAILLIEMTYFLRLGKAIYLETNDTVGLLTMQKKHLTVNMDKKTNTMKFKAKSNKEQIFITEELTQPLVYDTLLRLYNNAKDQDSFIFTNKDGKEFTERKLNLRLNKCNITLKNLRTFGVNLLLLRNIFNIMNETDRENKGLTIKKLITNAKKLTAERIGHSLSISDKSYMADEILEVLNNELSKENIWKIKSFDDFVLYIIDKIQ